MPGVRAPEETRRAQILEAALEIATEAGLDGLSVRRVADRAGVSHGLVQFYFPKRELLEGVLELWLSRLSFPEGPAPAEREATARETLLALIGREVDRVTRDDVRITLFFDFWSLGARQAGIRERMRAELQRYREALRAAIQRLLPGVEPQRAEALTTLTVAFLQGYALQAAIDPARVRTDSFREEAGLYMGFLVNGGPDAAR